MSWASKRARLRGPSIARRRYIALPIREAREWKLRGSVSAPGIDAEHAHVAEEVTRGVRRDPAKRTPTISIGSIATRVARAESASAFRAAQRRGVGAYPVDAAGLPYPVRGEAAEAELAPSGPT